MSEDPVLRRKLLTFVIVGGGPTGVELAGAIVELARKAIVPRLPQHRFLDGAGHPRRGRTAAAHGVSRKPVAIGQVAARAARRRGAARPCGHAMRRARRDACRRRTRSARAACCGPPASWHRVPRNGWAPRPIAPAASSSTTISACPAIPRSSSSATRRWSRARMDSRCRASRRPPSRWAATPPG